MATARLQRSCSLGIICANCGSNTVRLDPISRMNDLKIELLRRSFRIRLLTWIGLVPILGLPFALIAFIQALFCRRLQRQCPNPGARYVLFALIAAPASIVFSLDVGFLFVRAILQDRF